MLSYIGRNAQFCCARYNISKTDFVDVAFCRVLINKFCDERVCDAVQDCCMIVRELAMIRDGLLELSDSRLNAEDVCAAICLLCTE